jgi:integrase
MPDEIKVHVVRYPGRKNLVLRYVDPITGKQVTKSAETSRRKDAEREAGKWQAELREGRYQKPNRMTWQEFRERYTSEKLSTLAENTIGSADSALNHLERIINPKMLETVNAEQLSRFQRLLTEEGMKPTTLATHLRAIRVALNWAHRKGFLRNAPDVDMPKGAKGIDREMRGRPITGEEFDRMIEAVPKVRKLEPEKWERLLRGLWLSGLRLGEALKLSWDADADIAVQVDGKYPRLRLLAEGHKARRDQLLPITPDFAEFLLKTSKHERHGLVFGIYGGINGEPPTTKRAGRYISAIGEKALVVTDPTIQRKRVDKETGEVTFVPGYASAHDLRRSFGTRWANKVMPRVLMQLMRHTSITTTMKFYVESNADSVQSELWKLAGNTLGNSGENQGSKGKDADSAESHNSLAGKA